ncbi:MAG: sigma-70 family RNA polymerase sigma factor [Archangium sp.]|nr:sigma-70 family RNA polymerase sigma factor [Archangium sp.]
MATQRAQRHWFAEVTPARRSEVVAQLFTAHRGQVLSSLRHWGLSEADADDVCSETFVVALRRMEHFEGRSSISTWLVGIARKLAADLRRSARVRLSDDGEVPEVADDSTAELALARCEQNEAVHRAVATLKPGPRAVVRRFMLDDVEMHEVAREQRVPLQTAYARLYAGQKALRLVLG